ncbi:DUF4198 domain-containing protein [Crateriforma spongiae]|uniref:DUF4198 domain-containing protein n=1 Tax=Crateriforma spongiae TaxID=2724528 RepID=UPI0014465853|nr:DUF4198 domain-containing protein [Crateriforma spongiae]
MLKSLTRTIFIITVFFGLFGKSETSAHDTWLQTNTPIVRNGQPLNVELCLGNHGNGHRDFLLASQVTLDWTTTRWHQPDGANVDLNDTMHSTSSAEKQGVWRTTVSPKSSGVHAFTQTLDKVLNHGRPIRSQRTAKTYVAVGPMLDSITLDDRPHQKPFGWAFEVVLDSCPFREVVAGEPLTAKVLLHHQPLADCRVSLIPEGGQLAENFDPRYEADTDDQGNVTLVPPKPGRYLLVAHHTASDEKSDEYDFTSYATTVTLHVPAGRPWVAVE